MSADLIVRAFPRAKHAFETKRPFRHENTHPQTAWNRRIAVVGGSVVADGNDGGADAVAGELRPAASDFLRRGRPRLGTAGDADRKLDVAAGSDLISSRKRRRPGSRAWRASSAAFRPR